jgi:hypothetical protein
MKLLDEKTAPDQIRYALGNTTYAKIAVAFWGKGAVEILGLDRDGLTLELICNLESGACNPSEIRKLKCMEPRVTIKSDPSLHAKVYWTPASAILGSSNASTNGLVTEGNSLGGWHEANLLVDEAGTLIDLKNWFDPLFAAAEEITEPMIKEAETLWKARQKLMPSGNALSTDLFSAFRAAPDLPVWQNVKIAFWSEYLSKAAKEDLKAISKVLPKGTEIDAYEGWRDQLGAGIQTVDFDLSDQSRPSYWRALGKLSGYPRLAVVRRQKSINFPALGEMQVSPADARKLRSLSAQIISTLGDGKSALVSLPDIVAEIDKELALQLERRFAAAMHGIYINAKAIGYPASDFLHMLNTQGAMITAQSLVMRSSPSSGFTALWERKRLDLTVEALVVEQPWRALFSPELLAAAQKRLDAYSDKPLRTGR